MLCTEAVDASMDQLLSVADAVRHNMTCPKCFVQQADVDISGV